MRRQSPNIKLAVQHKGLSLIELMISILISMIILASVIQVMLTSKITFLGQEGMSLIQENSRFALDVIGRDIQAAGFQGCAGSGANVAMVAQVDTGYEPWLGLLPLKGYDGAMGSANYPAPYAASVRDITDAAGAVLDTPATVIVRKAEGISQVLRSHTGTALTLANSAGFEAGDYVSVVAGDCQRLGVVRVNNIAGNNLNYNNRVCSGSVKPKAATDGEESYDCSSLQPSDGTTQKYLPGAMVQKYGAHAYFVGESSSGQPALMRWSLFDGSVRALEIAEGVEDIEVLYGVDASGDRIVDTYMDAKALDDADNWAAVRAVQVSLVMRSRVANLPEKQDQDLLGNIYSDRFMRQLVSATFQLRNRI